ncbi:DeoR/GlpR family DNA-binding transcription regulator [Pedococcus sp. 5OH_020]|uniref:DeoR/GlpR family DNA-binding transcription regulator n=1 Tax=Pedococcus sp. 5OH_020 TaxID=2989814 RepID=UPI0022EA01E5|nr:DeoR/GlpR family DNA-binding transcription regulator [Pedococcus sp. 5OH_020]
MARKVRKDASSAFAVERHTLILERLKSEGRLAAAALAEEIGTSTETIRRDLIALEQAGSLRRVHGGAVLESRRGDVPDVHQRGSLMTNEKAAIARLAASQVPVAALVLIDSGTTTHALAEAYPVDRGTTVVTPSLPVATTLLKRPGSRVHTLGGEVSPRTWSEGGSWTLRALQGLRAEVVFLGCSGFSAGLGATTSDEVDGDVKRGMVAAARRVVVLADSSKIGSQHLMTFAELDQIDLLITGRRADPRELQLISDAGVEIQTA